MTRGRSERMHVTLTGAAHSLSFGGDQQHYTDGAPTVTSDATEVRRAAVLLNLVSIPWLLSRHTILT